MINRGVEWLDAHDPNWRQKINKDTLNIRIWSKCILGQVFGMYQPGCPKDLENYGFTANTEQENQALIEEWKKVIDGV